MKMLIIWLLPQDNLHILRRKRQLHHNLLIIILPKFLFILFIKLFSYILTYFNSLYSIIYSIPYYNTYTFNYSLKPSHIHFSTSFTSPYIRSKTSNNTILLIKILIIMLNELLNVIFLSFIGIILLLGIQLIKDKYSNYNGIYFLFSILQVFIVIKICIIMVSESIKFI